MKRTKRALCVLLAVALLCVGLCGCNALDQARAAHAIWQEDGTILLRGATYRPLPDGFQRVLLDRSDDESIDVTAPDVPVLLAERYGDSAALFQDEVFLQHYRDDSLLYCREDRYEELCAQMDAGFPFSGYYYSYWTDPYDEVLFYDLTPAQTAAVMAVPVPENEITLDTSRDEEYGVALHGRSGNIRLDEAPYSIFRMNGIYYMDTNGAQPVLYRVPDALQPTFADIMEAKVQVDEGIRDKPPAFIE